MNFEVTIPFKREPWYTVNVSSKTEQGAEQIAVGFARKEGFRGPYSQPKVRLLDENS